MNRTSIFFIHEDENEIPQTDLDRMCEIAGIEEVKIEFCGRFYYLDLDWTDGPEYTPEEWDEQEKEAIALCRELNRAFPYAFRVDDGSQFGTFYGHSEEIAA